MANIVKKLRGIMPVNKYIVTLNASEFIYF